MPRLSGAQFIADSLAAYGVSHVFFVPAILNRTLAELDMRTDIKRILTHGEKSAARSPYDNSVVEPARAAYSH